MRAGRLVAAGIVALGDSLGAASASAAGSVALEPARGPLRVLAANPRYFTDGSGRAVYLTGSHVWWNLVGDEVWLPCSAPRHAFSYAAYLDRLASHGHNFIRMWRNEHSHWEECARTVDIHQHPWPRSGPGTALDGRPRFDLSRFDETYFQRLRDRVRMAGERGIYVSIMLFEGVQLQQAHEPWDWAGHPFNGANNVTGIDADVNGDGEGLEVNMLVSPAVLAVQEAYVRKVVDTVNDLDNVLYEIVNESGHYSTQWQYHMIHHVKAFEQTKAKRHPVGMTFQHAHGANASLFASPADWVSPFGREYMSDPPVASGRKVILSDTDHHCGVCGEPSFPWRNFLRGHNPIFMDPMDDDPTRHAVRSALGQTRRYARRVGLGIVRPRPAFASTRYALVAPGRRYLVYQPGSGRFRVDLRGTTRRFAVEWFRPETDTSQRTASVRGGRVRLFRPPFAGPAVLFLHALGRR
jgi:hypothetical protein